MKKYSGFTLIEVIISVFIMTLIMMIILPVFMSIMEAKSFVESSGVRQMREAQALMSIIQRDLRSAFLSNSVPEDKFIIINSQDLEGNAVDEMYFTSFSRYNITGSANFSDQCEVGYYIKEDDEKKLLFRKESKIIDDDLIEGGGAVKLTDKIAYFDIVVYKDGFSSTGDFGEELEEPMITTFPRGVLIKFGLKVDDEKVIKYETAIALPPYIVETEEGGADGESEGEGNDASEGEEGGASSTGGGAEEGRESGRNAGGGNAGGK